MCINTVTQGDPGTQRTQANLDESRLFSLISFSYYMAAFSANSFGFFFKSYIHSFELNEKILFFVIETIKIQTLYPCTQ